MRWRVALLSILLSLGFLNVELAHRAGANSTAVSECDALIMRKLEELERLVEQPFEGHQLYTGSKPVYESQASGEAVNGINRSRAASHVPEDVEEVLQSAIAEPESQGKVWWSYNKDCGCWYRYVGDIRDGKPVVHWDGITRPAHGTQASSEGRLFLNDSAVGRYAKRRAELQAELDHLEGMDEEGLARSRGQAEPSEPSASATSRDYHLDAGQSSRNGVTLRWSETEYRPPGIGQTAKEYAEEALGKKLGREIAHGGFRRTFPHPTDPSKVVKVYDAALNGVSPELIAQNIQRELAMEDFLRETLEPLGIEVAKIDRNPEFLQRGIIVQDKSFGTPLSAVNKAIKAGKNPLGLQAARNLKAKFDVLWTFFQKYDKTLQKLCFERFGWVLKHGNQLVGLDLGGLFSNVFVTNEGGLVLVDW